MLTTRSIFRSTKRQIFLVLLFAEVFSPGYGGQTVHEQPEDWVRAQLSKGKIANIRDHFGERKVLSSAFLASLLLDRAHRLHRHGVRIENAIFTEEIDLKNANIDCEVKLVNCIFEAPVNITEGHLGYGLDFSKSLFRQTCSFGGIVVQNNLDLDSARFETSADFRFANIGRNLQARWTQFRGKDSRDGFNSLHVGGNVYFDDATFVPPMDFIHMDVKGQLSVSRARFESDAIFNASSAESGFFQDIVFNGPVDFSYVEFTKDFDVRNSHFNFQGSIGYFSSIKVRGNVILIKTTFLGPSNFSFSEIGGNFLASLTHFNDDVNLGRMTVGVQAQFDSTVFEKSVSMRDANFHTLTIISPKWGSDSGSLVTEGLRFENVGTGENQESLCDTMLRFLARSEYSADVYTSLENYFQRRGYRRLGDRVYIEGKERERREVLRDRPFKRLINLAAYYFMGYGRRPEYSFAWAGGLLLLGCYVFRRRMMDLRHPQETHGCPAPRYNAFSFSFDLMIPLVRLPTAEQWIPKEESNFTWLWYRVHKIAGWIFITIGVATWTGILK